MFLEASSTSDAFAEQIGAVAREAQLKSVAVATYDFATGREWHINGDRWFHAASTIKVAVLVALASAVGEGRFQLLSRLAVRNRFLSAADGFRFVLRPSVMQTRKLTGRSDARCGSATSRFT